ncbi:hypothetical protein BPNPMPFG_002463 [Mesorhizobium sp. AR07]|uniref:hypothetical protein n=1 Tax=Mesorhizobium sp. AR07 TaxID=2865838 RepID=UPI00215F76EB|nr:hypothetical protein [Mesorhizobium sp. AR07]UVK46755.1 hypothetical protein BPNPMPFG_002463 [Mesorhizobium sp. AR07]
MPDIFPPYRHIVVINDEGKRRPAQILVETPHSFSTADGLFMKDNGKQWGFPQVTFEGPFTAEGDMESRP